MRCEDKKLICLKKDKRSLENLTLIRLNQLKSLIEIVEGVIFRKVLNLPSNFKARLEVEVRSVETSCLNKHQFAFRFQCQFFSFKDEVFSVAATTVFFMHPQSENLKSFPINLAE